MRNEDRIGLTVVSLVITSLLLAISLGFSAIATASALGDSHFQNPHPLHFMYGCGLAAALMFWLTWRSGATTLSIYRLQPDAVPVPVRQRRR